MSIEERREIWKKASKKYRDKKKAEGAHIIDRTHSDSSHGQNYRNKCKIREVGKCAMCGHKEQLVGHHIIPAAEEGSTDALSNLICLCKPCHTRIHKRMQASEWDYEQVVDNLQLLKICMEL